MKVGRVHLEGLGTGTHMNTQVQVTTRELQPFLVVWLGAEWDVFVTGTYGFCRYSRMVWLGAKEFFITRSYCQCNLAELELSAEISLFNISAVPRQLQPESIKWKIPEIKQVASFKQLTIDCCHALFHDWLQLLISYWTLTTGMYVWGTQHVEDQALTESHSPFGNHPQA